MIRNRWILFIAAIGELIMSSVNYYYKQDMFWAGVHLIGTIILLTGFFIVCASNGYEIFDRS